jgi:hypothetical protein
MKKKKREKKTKQNPLRSKAQVSTEFIVILAIALGAFIFIFSVANDRNADALNKRTMILARQTLESLTADINRAAIAGSGTRITHTLAPTLSDGYNYSITIAPSQRVAQITWQKRDQNRTYSAPLISSNISGTLQFYGRAVEINNENGGIIIQ